VVGISNERLTALLCNHSAFSFGAATATPTTLVRRAAELGYRSLALTDTLNVSGAVELTEAANAHGLQAIIGATIPVRVHERLVAPLVLIATSRHGYTTLNTLITHAHAGDALMVPWPVLLQHTQDLICLTGGREGFPTQLLARRELVELAGLIRELKGAFRDRLYLQLYHDLLP